MSELHYQICTRCVMDTSDPDITFNNAGLCSHCQKFDRVALPVLQKSQSGARLPALHALIEKIKGKAENNDYDCVLGLSGGVDSSYLALVAKDAGLRVLAVHCDSGWNSELAVANIENIVKILGFDLYTYVIDWDEMRDLQLAFFKASLANCDIPQDHAFAAALYAVASKHGIKTIISGSNYATEAILPASWGYDASDLRHIRAVHKKFGTRKLDNYPVMPFWKRYLYYPFIRGIENHHILNYVPYEKAGAKALLKEKLGWRDYGGKHYESVFTKFFQSYYLPVKFGFDKRRAHLSSLIAAEQIMREDALLEMQQPSYDEATIGHDREFVAKKLGISLAEMDRIFALPPRSFRDYPSNEALFAFKDRIMQKIRSVRRS